jgi:glycosyltransferase involved in cell wall biosynthesis
MGVIWLKNLYSRIAGWFYSMSLKGYLFFKPRILPFIIRSSRIHRFLFFSKEAAKTLLHPGKVLPPNENALFGGDSGQIDNPIPSTDLTASRIPGWLQDEWREIHFLEPSTFPHSDFLNIIPFYEVPRSNIAEPYLRLRGEFGEGITHVFLVPWLRKGGADLTALNMIHALIDISPESRPLVLATMDVVSEWKWRLPRVVKYIEFGRDYDFLSQEEQEKLLTRCLLQVAPKVVHNINSELGYHLFAKYGAALSDTSRLFASSFCGDRCPEGRMVGYPFGPLNDCFDYLTGVISDNQAHIDQLVQIYGMERKNIFLHYQPAPAGIPVKSFDEDNLKKSSLDILWAGRIDRQKRPDILIKVAKACAELPIQFHVFGSSVLEEDSYSVHFARMGNVLYHGPFEGLTSLNVDDFDVFLNTSQWEGLPNILLEAMSMGLPVISSAVGGISELIRDDENGVLISPFDDIPRYKSVLSRFCRHRELLVSMGANALKIVQVQHSSETFRELVKKIPSYL